MQQSGTDRRRKAILASAREMIASRPLSMRDLAAAAGVSPATPYNLFGTKRRIFMALNEEASEALLSRIMASDVGDTLDRIYRAIRLVAEDLAEAPGFFRALFAEIYSGAAVDDGATSTGPAAMLWRRLMETLQGEGHIEAEVDIAAFTRNFVYMLAGATLDWTEGRISVVMLEDAVRYGFTLATLAVATDASRPRLIAVLARRRQVAP